MNIAAPSVIQFDLPQQLGCPLPTEERNIERDRVRLLVTSRTGETRHAIFHNLPSFLQKGDVLVVNTSATIPAALDISLPGGKQAKLHLSTKLSYKEWLVEIRQ